MSDLVGALILALASVIAGTKAFSFIYASMIVLVIVMVYSVTVGKKRSWGKMVVGGCGIIVIILAFTKVFRISSGIEAKQARAVINQKIDDARSRHDTARLTEAGNIIGGHFRGSRALVILSPYIDENTRNHYVEALKTGVLDRVIFKSTQVSHMPVESDSQDTADFDVNRFDYLLLQNPDCDLVVSLVDLPQNLKEIGLNPGSWSTTLVVIPYIRVT